MRKKSFYLLCDRVFLVLKIFRQWTGKKTDLPRISVYKTYMHSISSMKVFCWLNCMKRLIFPESRFMESWSSAWNIVTVVCLVFDLTHPFLGYRSRANSRPTTVSNPASHLSKRGDHKIKEISTESRLLAQLCRSLRALSIPKVDYVVTGSIRQFMAISYCVITWGVHGAELITPQCGHRDSNRMPTHMLGEHEYPANHNPYPPEA